MRLATWFLVLALSVPALARVKPKKKADPAAEATDDAEASKEARAKAAFDAAETKGSDEPSPAASPSPAPAGDEAGDAAAVANMLALSGGQAPAPTGPPAALARKLVPVLAALNQRIRFQPPLKMQELQYFGAADVDGDGAAELIISWARGNDQGGVALARRTETEHKIVAVADVKEPVLRVQAIPLAGDKTRHLLIRSGGNIPGGGTSRRMAVWGAVAGKLQKIWEQHDVDRIEGNGDISQDREAKLSDVTFKDGVAGKPGSLTVAVTEYRAPRGKGPEATETRGARTLHYVFDKKRGVLVLKSKEEATPEQLKHDEMGAAGPGASGVVPESAEDGEKPVRARPSEDTPVNQRDISSDEVVNATGLAAKESLTRTDLPASPGERHIRSEQALRKRGEKNAKRRQKLEDEAKKAKEEAAPTETESAEPTGEESGPRPKGVEAVDGAK